MTFKMSARIFSRALPPHGGAIKRHNGINCIIKEKYRLTGPTCVGVITMCGIDIMFYPAIPGKVSNRYAP